MPTRSHGFAQGAATQPALSRRRFARLKDALERSFAALSVLAALPVWLALAALVKITSRGPVLHRRRVVGLHGREFDAFKFRTMVTDADAILASDAALSQAFAVSHKLRHDPRVTPVGAFLRRYSLDELPQLFNVVRGEMALIGPRMITAAELEKYGSHAGKLLTVKPGLTGLWQVSGRQTTTYQRRVELDMHYIDNWSLAVDFSILLRTFAVVVRADGAY